MLSKILYDFKDYSPSSVRTLLVFFILLFSFKLRDRKVRHPGGFLIEVGDGRAGVGQGHRKSAQRNWLREDRRGNVFRGFKFQHILFAEISDERKGSLPRFVSLHSVLEFGVLRFQLTDVLGLLGFLII